MTVDLPSPERKLGEITVKVEHPSGEPLHCLECEAVMAGYDSRPRRWRHLNTMQLKTFVEAQVPRGECAEHGTRQVKGPWAEDSFRFRAMLEAFSIDVLLSVRSKVQAQFLACLSWDQVDRVMKRAVVRGLERRNLEELVHLGIDEKSFEKGHDYDSVLCDIEGKSVIEVVREQTLEAAKGPLSPLPVEQRCRVKAVAIDMWEFYAKAATELLRDPPHQIPCDAGIDESGRSGSETRTPGKQEVRQRRAFEEEQVRIAQEPR